MEGKCVLSDENPEDDNSILVYEANADIYNDDDLIAFTWSPDPQKYFTSKPRRQYKALLNHCLLSAYKCFDRFCFIPELNTNGYVHIHGWYHVKDKIKYFKWFLPRCRQFGFVLCKTKPNKMWYEDYLLKEIYITSGIIGNDLPIPLTHYNVKDYKDIFIKARTIKYKPCILKKNIEEYFKIK